MTDLLRELLLLDWKNLLSFVSFFLVIPSVFVGLWTYVLKPAWTLMKNVWNCVSRLDQFMSLIDSMAKEFKPNGGNSLRDVLNRLEAHTLVTDTKIQAMMHYHAIPAWESNAEGECVWASNQLLRILGLSADQVMGSGWLTGIRDADRDRVRDEWQAAVDEKRDFLLTYSVGVDKPVQVIARAFCTKDTKGNVKGFIGTLEII